MTSGPDAFPSRESVTAWPELQTTGEPTRAAAPIEGRLRARAFGISAVDLDVDFTAAGRAQAVTELLSGCLCDVDGESIPATELWQWTLNRRLQALLAVRLAGGSSRAPLVESCRACHDTLEIDLDLSAFVAAPVAPVLAWRSPDDSRVVFRLPNGRDQQRWIHGGMPEPTAIASTLIESIDECPPQPAFLPPHAWLGSADVALGAHDPLTTLTLNAGCPTCAHVNEIEFDLERFLLEGFAETQRVLIDEVWRLASVFHWGEAEILALPAWRRARYLQRLGAGGVA